MTAHPGDRLETRHRPRGAFDLLASAAFLARGRNDPTFVIAGGVIWRTWQTRDGIATLALRQRGDEVLAAAWGPGAETALAAVPQLCGADDSLDGFDAGRHPLIEHAHHRNPGLRLVSAPPVDGVLVCAILEQKVTGLQAFGAWRALVSRYGAAAPGPVPRRMHAAPRLSEWGRIPSWAWHRAGVEPPQSRTVVRAAARAASLIPALESASMAERDRLLRALAGVGEWTSAEVRIRAYADADAVSVGDYHLAHHVGHALAGARTDDAGMLELLQPWRGHRQRVIRLIWASGAYEPRRGARLAPEDHRGR